MNSLEELSKNWIIDANDILDSKAVVGQTYPTKLCYTINNKKIFLGDDYNCPHMFLLDNSLDDSIRATIFRGTRWIVFRPVWLRSWQTFDVANNVSFNNKTDEEINIISFNLQYNVMRLLIKYGAINWMYKFNKYINGQHIIDGGLGGLSLFDCVKKELKRKKNRVIVSPVN